MTPTQHSFAGGTTTEESGRIFNLLQIVSLAVLLVLICGFAARSVGLGWGTTLVLAWGSGIFGTLLVALSIFAVHEAVTQYSGVSVHADEASEVQAMIDEWDNDLASDDMANGTTFWFGHRSVLRKASLEASPDHQEVPEDMKRRLAGR